MLLVTYLSFKGFVLLGSYQLQEFCLGISDPSSVEFTIPYCQKTSQECPLSVVNPFPIAYDE